MGEHSTVSSGPPTRGPAWASSPAPVLGAHPTAAGVEFAVWTGGEEVDLCLFDDDRVETRIRMTDRGDGVHHRLVDGLEPGARYGFRVQGPWRPEIGDRYNAAKLLLDPYARAIDGELDHTGPVTGHGHSGNAAHADLVRDDRDSAPFVPLSVVVASAHTVAYDWGDDAPPRTPWADTVVYEAHVRGLTRLHPAVPEQLRGTYAGLAHPVVLEHLRELGVTAVELLPVHHFVSEPAVASRLLENYWGYSSVGFFAPHARYSSTYAAPGWAQGSHDAEVTGTPRRSGAQVGEFKDMVRALHTAGLEVILDVVYNHTAEGPEDGPTLGLRGLGNREYYRLREGGRRYDDTTGCGNTLDLTHPRTLALVLDSLRYWVGEMHVDGFRFDLAPALARTASGVDMSSAFFSAIRADPSLCQVKLISEPWDIGPDGYQLGNFPPEWTEWNDRFRDTVRDFWRGSTHGVRDLGYRLSGSSDLYRDDGRRPYASINFITAHDGFTLRDLVSYNRKHNDANGENGMDGADHNRSWNCAVEGETDDDAVQALRRRQLRNLAGTLLLSTGVPMLVAGDELGRTQRGNNNAYCQDNDISWVDWEGAADWQDLRAFVARALRLRREHSTLRQRHFFRGQPVTPGGPKDLTWISVHGAEMSHPEWHDEHLKTLGMLLSGEALRPDGERADGEHADDRRPDDGRPDDGRPGDGDPAASFLLWLHADAVPVDVRLPALPAGSVYVRKLDTDSCDGAPQTDERTAAPGTRLHLPARSLLLLQVAPG